MAHTALWIPRRLFGGKGSLQDPSTLLAARGPSCAERDGPLPGGETSLQIAGRCARVPPAAITSRSPGRGAMITRQLREYLRGGSDPAADGGPDVTCRDAPPRSVGAAPLYSSQSSPGWAGGSLPGCRPAGRGVAHLFRGSPVGTTFVRCTPTMSHAADAHECVGLKAEDVVEYGLHIVPTLVRGDGETDPAADRFDPMCACLGPVRAVQRCERRPGID